MRYADCKQYRTKAATNICDYSSSIFRSETQAIKLAVELEINYQRKLKENIKLYTGSNTLKTETLMKSLNKQLLQPIFKSTLLSSFRTLFKQFRCNKVKSNLNEIICFTFHTRSHHKHIIYLYTISRFERVHRLRAIHTKDDINNDDEYNVFDSCAMLQLKHTHTHFTHLRASMTKPKR